MFGLCHLCSCRLFDGSRRHSSSVCWLWVPNRLTCGSYWLKLRYLVSRVFKPNDDHGLQAGEDILEPENFTFSFYCILPSPVVVFVTSLSLMLLWGIGLYGAYFPFCLRSFMVSCWLSNLELKQPILKEKGHFTSIKVLKSIKYAGNLFVVQVRMRITLYFIRQEFC